MAKLQIKKSDQRRKLKTDTWIYMKRTTKKTDGHRRNGPEKKLENKKSSSDENVRVLTESFAVDFFVGDGARKIEVVDFLIGLRWGRRSRRWWRRNESGHCWRQILSANLGLMENPREREPLVLQRASVCRSVEISNGGFYSGFP